MGTFYSRTRALPSGVPFHGEVTSADATGAGVALTLYKEASTAAYTLLASEYISITDITIATGAAVGKVGLYQTTDANGKRIKVIFGGTNGGITTRYETPFKCLINTVPKLVAANAGNVECQVEGYITSS